METQIPVDSPVLYEALSVYVCHPLLFPVNRSSGSKTADQKKNYDLKKNFFYSITVYPYQYKNLNRNKKDFPPNRLAVFLAHSADRNQFFTKDITNTFF